MNCQLPYIRKAKLSETEKSRLEGIHLDILNQAKSSKVFRREGDRFVTLKNEYPKATEFIAKINDSYKQVVATLPAIGNGKHSLNVNTLPLSEDQQGTLLQVPGEKTIPKSSTQLVKLSKEFLTKIGVKYETADQIVVNGKIINANAAAFLTQGLVQVVNGKEEQALPEEAMHFALAIIKQTNPKLYNKLMSEVNKFQILKDVFSEYGNDPLYQKDGKPDVIKLKEEAIGKVLAEVLGAKAISSIENPQNISSIRKIWNSIVEFLKELFNKSGFDQAAMSILSGEFEGSVAELEGNQEDVFLQQANDKQSEVFNKLKLIQSQVIKKEDGYYVNGVKVPRRVTDIIKGWYENRFKDKDLTKDEFDKAVDDLKAEKGTAGHADIEYAFSLFVNKDGFLREVPLDDSEYVSQINPDDRAMYEMLRDNLKERLNSFPKGTRFMAEAIIYDEKRGIAGTMDFIGITPEGKVNILDWKFMDLNIDKYSDVPWYKVNAWRQQMDQYKLILERVYGIQKTDFQQTRMIPIKAYYTKGNKKENILPRLDKIEIGAVDPKKITSDYLIPVGSENEKTGNKKVDQLIEKLNALYAKFSDKKVIPSERLSKAEQLNALFSAIRQLQMKQNIKPLLDQANILNRQIEATISKFNKQWSGKNPTEFTQKEISDFYEEIETAHHAIEQYTNLDTELKFLFRGELSEDDKKLKDELRNTVDDARSLMSDLLEVSGEFVDQFVAGSEKVNNILSPEKVIKGITKWFSSTSTIQLKALEVLYKKANRAFTYASMDTVDETKILQKLKQDYDKWAQSKGLDKNTYFDLIKKKESNELIDEFDSKFYKSLKEAIDSKDFKWIKDNIDVVEYNKYLKQKLENEIKRIIDKPRVITQEEQNAIDKYRESGEQSDLPFSIRSQIDNLKSLYNTSNTESPGWFLYNDIKKFPQKKWETKEWKELHLKGNEAALAFYNYIKQKNLEYAEIGYVHDKQARTFLPFVRKGLTEKIIFGGQIALGEQFLRAISIDEGDIGYGKIDPLTGRPIDVIPTYFTREIEGELSTDLFRNIALYNEMAIRYKYLKDIESQARALINTERSKKAIATSMFGKTVYEDGVMKYTPDNNDNTKLVEDMVKSIIYGQRYLQSETFDQVLGSIGGFGKKANDKLGIKIFPEDMEGRQISINKVINQLNTTFQLNALGLNPLSALSNLLGGSFQSTINAGTYFTKTDFMATEMWLLMNKMTGKDQKKMVGALEYFLPLTDSYNKEIAKTLSLSKLSQENIQEFLMILMRKSDFFVQTANFYAFINNSIVQDGKVVNAREYLKSQPEYINLYSLPYEERKKKEDQFEEDVKKIIEEKGVMKLGEVKDDKFVIPGVNRKDDSIIEVRRKVQKLSKDALGNLSEDDVRTINMNIFGKSFMIFKNWIPRPVDVRMGNLKYNSASDAYEWGRMRMVFRILSDDLLHSLNNLYNAFQGNEEGVKYMHELWEKKKADYETETGKKLEMTEDQFMNLVRYNIKAQLVDTLFMLTLFSFYLGLKALAPDDDEDPKVKNAHKFLLRAVDKIKDELWFFYDPTSLTSLVSSGIFPALGYINNLKRFVEHFRKEVFGIISGDEKAQEKAYPIKYLMKSFPVTNQATQIIPLFYPELAKDLGIKPTTQARPIAM